MRHLCIAMALVTLCSLSTGIVAAQSPLPSQTTYKYDALGRLIEVRYPNGRVVTYAYDPAGNRRQVVTGG